MTVGDSLPSLPAIRAASAAAAARFFPAAKFCSAEPSPQDFRSPNPSLPRHRPTSLRPTPQRLRSAVVVMVLVNDEIAAGGQCVCVGDMTDICILERTALVIFVH